MRKSERVLALSFALYSVNNKEEEGDIITEESPSRLLLFLSRILSVELFITNKKTETRRENRRVNATLVRVYVQVVVAVKRAVACV